MLTNSLIRLCYCISETIFKTNSFPVYNSTLFPSSYTDSNEHELDTKLIPYPRTIEQMPIWEIIVKCVIVICEYKLYYILFNKYIKFLLLH